jgi:hypothetical protein
MFSNRSDVMRLLQPVGLVLVTANLLGSAANAQVSFTPGPLTDQDKADIQRLWSEYQRTLFACDGDGYADLFATPGGYFASAPRGEIRERKALIEMVVGYDRCEPGAKPSAESAPRPSAANSAPRFPTPVIEAAPEGARSRIINSRGGGYYDDVYVRTPSGWKFKSRTVIADNELAAGLSTQDFIEIRALAGDDHGHYDDIYGHPDGDIKPRALSKPGAPFRTSGLRITLGKDGSVNGLAYLRDNGGHYEDVYVKTPQGWRIKERKYFKP